MVSKPAIPYAPSCLEEVFSKTQLPISRFSETEGDKKRGPGHDHPGSATTS